MNPSRKTVCILFGGQSAEHDISILSATAIFRNLDRERFKPQLVYLRRDGRWRHVESGEMDSPTTHSLSRGKFHSILPWHAGIDSLPEADIHFPVLHGPNGEDGRIPALLELDGRPFVGAGSLGSALAMDKGIAKRLFLNANIPTPAFRVYDRNDPSCVIPDVEKHLTYPVFVKPCSLGSSVGISKVKSRETLAASLALAFFHDRHVIVEQGIDGREIEVAVMGNRELEISPPGELEPHNEFYDYADKYTDGRTRFHIPAELPIGKAEEIRTTAAAAFRTLQLNGLSRVDFFMEKQSGRILVNEINTMPGFTEISMFPKLFALKEYSFTTLLTRLIEYGFDYHAGIPKGGLPG